MSHMSSENARAARAMCCLARGLAVRSFHGRFSGRDFLIRIHRLLGGAECLAILTLNHVPVIL